MERSNKLGWMSFVLSLSTVSAITASPGAMAAGSVPLESRLATLNQALQERAASQKLPGQPETPDTLAGFANGGGGRGFADTRRGGFVNRNGWSDGGGGFVNRR